jgi:hypothetical protein
MRNMQAKAVEVHCYSGYTYPERPDSFLWEGTSYIVRTVEREWREPGGRHFKVHTDNNGLFELCYDDDANQWILRELA